MAQGGEIGYFFVGIDEKNSYLAALQGVVQFLLLQAPAFAAKAFDAVTVYRVGKVAARGCKPCLHRILLCRQGSRHKNHAIRKNRKRFSVSKKRFNQFPAL